MKTGLVPIVASALLVAALSGALFHLANRAHPDQEQYGDDDFAGATVCSKDVPPSLENIEDYDWAYCSFDLHSLWNALNIKEAEFTDSSSLAEALSVFGDLDYDGTNERILRLTLKTSTAQRIRFVVLKSILSQGRTHWRPLAWFDISQFHLAPEARVAYNARRSWLVISNHEQAWNDDGTEIQENETWYELRGGRLIPVLTFPSEVEHASRQIKSDVVAVSFDGRTDRVDVALTATFSFENSDAPVTIQRKISFSKDLLSREFTFDAKKSEVSELTYINICDIVHGQFTRDQLTKLR